MYSLRDKQIQKRNTIFSYITHAFIGLVYMADFIFMYAAIGTNVNIAFFPLIGTRYKMSRSKRETPLVV